MDTTLFERLKNGLSKTKKNIVNRIENLFKTYGKLNDEFYEELEEILVTSHVGIASTTKIVEELKIKVKETSTKETEAALELLKEILISFLKRKWRTKG